MAIAYIPQELSLEITTECNLRCKQCHMWRSRERSDSLSTDEKLGVIREIARLNPNVSVSISGGETLLKHEEFFAMTRLCRNLGLRCTATTNGTLFNQETICRLRDEGPTYLFISLDSHVEELHDWLRGMAGAFSLAIDAIRRVVDCRGQRSWGSFRVFTNTILFDRNLAEIAQTVHFLHGLGVDGMSFQVLSNTFMLAGKRDSFFDAHFPRDAVLFDECVDQIEALSRDGVPILTTPNDLRWMRLYVRNPDFISEPVCGSGERNVMVDQYGDVTLCHSMKTITGGRALGNVRSDRLTDLLYSDLAGCFRTMMSECRLSCGMLNCHRKRERNG